MGCCGQNRAALSNSLDSQPMTGLQSTQTASLRFVQKRSIIVRGPETGRRYQFRDGAYTSGVAMDDATALLKTGFFEAARMKNPLTQASV